MAFLRRHIVAVFFGLTYAISWGMWGWVAAAEGELTGWRGLAALFGAFGPALAGLVCAGLLDGRSGVRALLSRLAAWRVRWTVTLAVFLGPLLLVLLPLGLHSLMGERAPDWGQLRRLPELFPTFLSMLLIGGLTEEPGWRGFALPVLTRRHGPLAASLILGFVWGLWHLPIYTLPALGDPLPVQALARFILTTPLLAILFTALAEHSGQSVWMAMLFHAWVNTVSTRLPGLLGAPEGSGLAWLNLLVWLLAAAPFVASWLRAAPPPAREAAGLSAKT